jgi:hypothetical protein
VTRGLQVTPSAEGRALERLGDAADVGRGDRGLFGPETLRTVSFVVAVCSSTAPAIVAERLLISPMMLPISVIAPTARCVSA